MPLTSRTPAHSLRRLCLSLFQFSNINLRYNSNHSNKFTLSSSRYRSSSTTQFRCLKSLRPTFNKLWLFQLFQTDRASWCLRSRSLCDGFLYLINNYICFTSSFKFVYCHILCGIIYFTFYYWVKLSLWKTLILTFNNMYFI